MDGSDTMLISYLLPLRLVSIIDEKNKNDSRLSLLFQTCSKAGCKYINHHKAAENRRNQFHHSGEDRHNWKTNRQVILIQLLPLIFTFSVINRTWTGHDPFKNAMCSILWFSGLADHPPSLLPPPPHHEICQSNQRKNEGQLQPIWIHVMAKHTLGFMFSLDVCVLSCFMYLSLCA